MPKNPYETHYSRYKFYLSKACDLQRQSEGYLTMAAQNLALHKGFTEEESLEFDACFVSGQETTVSYKGVGNENDLDLTVMENMSKEEILYKLFK